MLNLIAVFLVCSGIGIAVHIAIDLTHRPQSMKIMNAVWILSALWGSYLALWAYNKFGRSSPMKMEDDGMKGMGMSDMKDMDMSGMKDMNMLQCNFKTILTVKTTQQTILFSIVSS